MQKSSLLFYYLDLMFLESHRAPLGCSRPQALFLPLVFFSSAALILVLSNHTRSDSKGDRAAICNSFSSEEASYSRNERFSRGKKPPKSQLPFEKHLWFALPMLVKAFCPWQYLVEKIPPSPELMMSPSRLMKCQQPSSGSQQAQASQRTSSGSTKDFPEGKPKPFLDRWALWGFGEHVTRALKKSYNEKLSY